MVAKELGTMYIRVEVPEYRQGFRALQGEVVEIGIRAGWYALSKRMQIAYNVELGALSKAIGRAEWLAMSVPL